MDIIGVILGLCILVTIHELGHFIAAKLCDVKVEAFSIGFGPRIFAFKKGETEYRFSLILLGGYVKMYGENPDEFNDIDSRSFSAKSWWQRAFIAFAGPMANLILALLIFVFSFWIGKNFEDRLPIVGRVDSTYANILQPGDKIVEFNQHKIEGWNQLIEFINKDKSNDVVLERGGDNLQITLPPMDAQEWFSKILPFADAEVGEVLPGLPAYKAGLKVGDIIISINGTDINDWYDMRESIVNSKSSKAELIIKRNDKYHKKTIDLNENLMSNNEKMIGITQVMPVKIEEEYSFGEGIKLGAISTVNSIVMTYYGLYKLVLKPEALKDNVGSVVMMVPMSKSFAKKGFSAILSLMASISILLMIVNLLPIPLLDGGQMFFCFIEGILGKPLPMKIQGLLQRVGIGVLLFLTIFTIFNDFSKIISRSYSINNEKSIKVEAD